MKIFGFEFGRPKGEKDLEHIIPTDASDNNASAVMADGVYSVNSAISVDSVIATENGFIEEYRKITYHPEVMQCINEIASEAIVFQADKDKAVQLNFIDDGDAIPDKLKEQMQDEFDHIYGMLDFDRRGHEIFKRWYIDGRLNYMLNIDKSSPKDGILSIQYVDPRKIKKVKRIRHEYSSTDKDMIIKNEKSYFVFNESGVGSTVNSPQAHSIAKNQERFIASDSVVYVPSGQIDQQSGIVISPLHTAIKTANNLRIMEEAALIYRLARAPERRVFYVDTGNLPKAKAEQHVQSLANKHRVSAAYDSTTGEIRNDKKYLAMTEDFWLARRGNQSGTQVDTLQGGQQAGEMGEAEYFRNKLYVALGIPANRFSDQPSMFDSGTSITRDELRMSRMIDRHRSSFSTLFEQLLKRQLILTGAVTVDEWEEIKGSITFKYAADTHFAEALRQERIRNSVDMVQSISQYVGNYFSKEYVYKHVINLSDEEIVEMKKQIAAEKRAGDIVMEEGDTSHDTDVYAMPAFLENID